LGARTPIARHIGSEWAVAKTQHECAVRDARSERSLASTPRSLRGGNV
jgi:hypothetical protein